MPGKPVNSPIASAVPYILTVGAVFLAAQIVIQPLVMRGPVEAAVRVAPGSPQALRRAAEAELTAGRAENAGVLGRNALSRSPFDVRALRVVGLTEAQAERRDSADNILTLAGNWSLRDDPAHAWLVEHRLRRGDYASAFAHADTLARRRAEVHAQVFNLFAVAAAHDPQRALPALTRVLIADPPWRSAFLAGLNTSKEGLQTAANLAILMQASPAPFTNPELQRFYTQAFERGHVQLLNTVRFRLNRPRADAAVTNGGFDDPAAPQPFQWTLVQQSGAVAEVMPDDLDRANSALRVEYDGYSPVVFTRQQMFLSPGGYRFRAGFRTESGEPVERMEWIISCSVGGTKPMSLSAIPVTTPGNPTWRSSTMDFRVAADCPSQVLELRGVPLDRRSSMVVWFDRVAIVPLEQ